MKHLLIVLAFASSPALAAQNHWPLFYGSYSISAWDCQSTFKDSGCLNSKVIRIYEAEGLTNIDILDGNGQLLRTNDLKEKGDDKTSYVFGGTSEAPSFTVEAKDSHGRRYFYNYFEITRHGFTQLQESDLGGLKQSIRRVFSFNN